jgi:hypothetical protein
VTGPDGWDCEAYGPHARADRVFCFFADPGDRGCLTLDVCRSRLAEERRRAFRAIQERAAAGDPDMAALAAGFTNPGQLLRGDGADPP